MDENATLNKVTKKNNSRKKHDDKSSKIVQEIPQKRVVMIYLGRLQFQFLY